jgi:hypothetical protein
MLDSIFRKARQIAKHNRLCYVNSDIIIMDDLIAAIGKIKNEKTLIIGRRIDIDLDFLWDFNGFDSNEKLYDYIKSEGKLHPPGGIDYFIFQKGMLAELLPFAVGRRGWDNWVIYHTRSLGIPVIDITKVATIAHQNHDYLHVPHSKGPKWEGPESDRNICLIGKSIFMWNINDADWILSKDGLKKKPIGLREVFCQATIKYPSMHSYLEIMSSTINSLSLRIRY